MRVKTVKRYFCDWCNKSGGAKHHMAKHEERCTKNPTRFCGLCHLAGRPQISIPEIVKIFSNMEPVLDLSKIREVTQARVNLLRQKTNNCPLCILAVLRQLKIPPFLMDGFNYREEFA